MPGCIGMVHLEPLHRGNAARFVNHSCQPNVEMCFAYGKTLCAQRRGLPASKKKAPRKRGAGRARAPSLRLPLLVLRTKVDVRAGEELTWDYGYSALGDKYPGCCLRCCCGEASCRRQLLALPWRFDPERNRDSCHTCGLVLGQRTNIISLRFFLRKLGS